MNGLFIFEDGDKTNFVDSHNVLLGYDMGQDCCEHTSWFVAEAPTTERPDVEQNWISGVLHGGWSFDPDFFKEIEDVDWTDHGGIAVFRIQNGEKEAYRPGSGDGEHKMNAYTTYFNRAVACIRFVRALAAAINFRIEGGSSLRRSLGRVTRRDTATLTRHGQPWFYEEEHQASERPGRKIGAARKEGTLTMSPAPISAWALKCRWASLYCPNYTYSTSIMDTMGTASHSWIPRIANSVAACYERNP